LSLLIIALINHLLKTIWHNSNHCFWRNNY